MTGQALVAETYVDFSESRSCGWDGARANGSARVHSHVHSWIIKSGKTHTRSKTEHQTVQEVFMTGQPLVADTYMYCSERRSCRWECAAERLVESPLTRGLMDQVKCCVKVIVVNVKRTNNHEHDQKQVS